MNGLFSDVLPLIQEHSRKESPFEAVGLIHKDGTITKLVNQARSSTRFSVGITQLEAHLYRPEHFANLHAIYHTHPKSTSHPSQHDQAMMKEMANDPFWKKIPFAILGLDKLTVWTWDDGLVRLQEEPRCQTTSAI